MYYEEERAHYYIRLILKVVWKSIVHTAWSTPDYFEFWYTRVQPGFEQKRASSRSDSAIIAITIIISTYLLVEHYNSKPQYRLCIIPSTTVRFVKYQLRGFVDFIPVRYYIHVFQGLSKFRYDRPRCKYLSEFRFNSFIEDYFFYIYYAKTY